jgi:pyruvate/2-oxoglutarate dehydrogenase complex dihydrolipoamide acyltransferase (E2) component
VAEIRIPKLGMDTTECEIKAWLVKVGDRVSVGTALLEVETEKADVVIEAEVAGVVREISAAAGQTVPVGSVVGLIDPGPLIEREDR